MGQAEVAADVLLGVLALENSIYSVISPEGCAAILWRSGEHSKLAAVAMKVTAAEQEEMGIVDIVVPEPGEGAHTDPAETARLIKEIVLEQLDILGRVPIDELVETRFKKFRVMGPYVVADQAPIPRERSGMADRLRDLLSGRRSMPSILSGRRDAPSGQEEE